MKYTHIALLSLVLLAASCAHHKQLKSRSAELPVVVLEHDDGKEDWGRLLTIGEDSLVIRDLNEMLLLSVVPNDIVAVYIVESEPANYPLTILSGLAVMGGTWGVVVAVYGESSSGSVLISSAIGILPAIYTAVKVADWTRGFHIIPLDIQGSDGRLDVNLLRQEIAKHLASS